jgi:hypothetical protein
MIAAMFFECPYLASHVELTDERRAHITSNHGDLLPQHEDRLAVTLREPDEIRIDRDYPRTRLFVRWFPDLMGGKLVVAAVVTDPPPAQRHWVVTGFIARKPAHGELEWRRP